MIKIRGNFLMVLLGLLLIQGVIYGQQLKSDLQKSEELEKTEKTLDDKIVQVNELLSKYSELQKSEIDMSPTQTTFTKGDGFIELESYEFINDVFSPSKTVGGRQKKVKLFFSGDKLAKIESEIVEENFEEKIKHFSKVVDPDPMSVANGDIEITSRKNNEKEHIVKLESMENSLSNPTRIKFKREFYLIHLNHFERLFRYTKQYQYQYGTGNNYKAVEILKKSLNY